MKTPLTDLLAEARSKGIELTEDGGRLRYEAPKNALTPELKQALSERKEEIVAFLKDARDRVRAPLTIEPAPRDEPLRASFAQSRLWFMHQLAPESPFYNVPAAPRVRGALDVAKLEWSLSALVERHEALRTTFAFKEGELFQHIEQSASVAVRRVDLTTTASTGAREAEARRLANEDCRRPFDLEAGPLLRVLLLRIDEDDHVLALTLHHIVSDGWSMGVLVRDLFALYRDSALEPLTVQYADYAYRQRERLKGDWLEHHLDYWTKELDGLEPLTLEADHGRPGRPTYRGERVARVVPAELTSKLRDFSSRSGTSLFTTLLAGFQALLHRYTGQEDVAVGCPVASRDARSLEDLIGFFVNSLVLRTRVTPRDRFDDLLRRVAQTAERAFAHQELPFDKLVEEIAPERDTQNPLFQIVFALQATPAVPDPSLTWAWADTGATRFDLEAHVFDDGSELELVFVYATDLFERATVERMESHFLALLRAAVENPGEELASLPLMERDERARVLELERPTEPSATAGTIQAWFERQAEATPDAVALRFGEQSLSYRALDRRANDLAHRLVEAGVEPETPVALFAERHPSTIVALLAILKASGLYVPLDASYPESRIERMLEDVGAPLVLTRKHPLLRGWERERDSPPESRAGARVGAGSDSLAYVMFTSGSTGVPKGSAATHGGVVRLVREARYVRLTPADVVLQLAPLSFDASTFEIWGALLNGATLALFTGDKAFPYEIARALRHDSVTTLWLTATLFNEMVDREPEALASVRQVLAGGEALSRAHVRRALDARGRPDGAVLVNGYGPTENTTFTCCHMMEADAALPKSVPIGRPIRGTFVRILDEAGEPAAIGVPGELYAGGDGLVRGYWSRPDLTAERFVPDPAATEGPGTRLYRTGDRCRWREDGTVEFLGRDDAQVKLRGFRVELREIEAALAEIPAVAEAACVVREDDAGDKKLVAYVVPEGASGTTGALGASQVSEWQTLFDRTYETGAGSVESDFTGWNSSYTGEPIPEIEMREWLDRTVERIRARRPERILEIGCGTGLLLHRLAPGAARYVATDFSERVLERLRERDLSGAELSKREANDFSGLESETFDTVVINSVTQYFPSTDYLLGVLREAARVVAPGGRIFIGDVRSLELLEAFHASVEHRLASAETSPEELAERVAHAVEQEAELVVSPDCFRAAADAIARITDVEILAKRGRFANELNRFRYDVFLHVGRPGTAGSDVGDVAWHDWQTGTLDEDSLAALLEGRVAPLGVRNVPDGRLAEVVALLEPDSEGRSGVDFENLHDIAARRGFRLETSYALAGGLGDADLLFRPLDDPSPLFFPAAGESDGRTGSGARPRARARGRALGNDPLRAKVARALVPLLREGVKAKVPEYMVPHLFVVLDALPVDANGKLDVRALPPPRRSRSASGEYIAPRSRPEKTIARIWSEILHIDRVGALDNFFELGGDSILGIQVVTRAREEGLALRAADIFESQTVRELAAAAGVSAPARESEAEAGAGDKPHGTAKAATRLAPVQQWFFSQGLAEPSHFNQSVLLTFDETVPVEILRAAAAALVGHHEALRSRFRRGADGWATSTRASDDTEVAVAVEVEVEVYPVDSLDALASRADSVQRSLDIESGPLVRFALFELGSSQPQRLLIVVHHLVVDAVSWTILLDDLARLLDGRGLLPTTAPYHVWAERAAAMPAPFADAKEPDPERALPRDHDGENLGASASTVRVYVEENEAATALAHDAEKALLQALAASFEPWTGSSLLPVTLERHGRDALEGAFDLTRTVGWFTELTPVLVDASSRAPSAAADVRPEVSFSYFGRAAKGAGAGAGFRLADESAGAGALQGPKNRRFHLIDVTARVESESGRLRADFHFSEAVHDRATIEALGRRFVEAVRAAGRSTDYALAPMQHGILFHSLYEDRDAGDVVYLQQYGIVLEDLDTSSFRRAWQEVVDRHPVLRTSIVDTDRQRPLQRVHASAELDVLERDLRRHGGGNGNIDDGDAPDASVHIQRFLEEDRRLGVDLGSAPLMRLAMFRVDEHRYECVWTFHHIVLDGWSVPLVLEEVFRFYAAFRRGERLTLPLPRPYRDYITWLGRQDPSRAEAFWRERLRGVSGRTPLDGFRDGGARGRVREDYGETRLDLTPEATDRLRALASKHRVTLNTAMLGAWALLLARYSGEDDVVFGTTVSGRPPELSGVESMIGLFINTLPTRVEVPPDGQLGSWLGELQRLQAGQREFQYAPLWEVQQWAGLPKGASLFDSLFVFENYPLVGESLPKDLRLRSRPSIERSGYPLAVAVSARESLSVRLYYKTSDFDAATVERLASHLRNIVIAMTSSPEPRIDVISPLSTAERRHLLVENNVTRKDFPLDRTVHQLIEAQSRRRPDALAVAAREGKLTFAELNERANRLARRLARLGVGDEDSVGVCLHRGLDLVVAELAIQKAGGAYVPLAPEYPRPRLGFILDNAGIRVLVTTEGLDSRLPAFDGEVIRLDTEAGAASLEKESPRDLDRPTSPDALAYVIYTSGSTGRPKGVEVTHRSLLNLVHWHRDAYDVRPSDRATSIASVGFDACVWELWPHLTAGASIHVPDEETRGTPSLLWDWLAKEAITLCFLPTPLAEAALEEPVPESSSLRVLMTGGDRLSRGLTRDLPFALVNHYGLTETAVVATSGRVGRRTPPPIGRAIANTTSYVLNRKLEPVPVGVPGELFIGGVGVARGYVDEPSLTAERFAADPFSTDPGARLYRTGDVARLLPDGEIEFLGRNDEQVKIRGHRIELAEIQLALTDHPAVRECLVLCRDDAANGSKSLVAYAVLESNPDAGTAADPKPEALSAPDLRAFLDERLPRFMVPASFVLLDAMPLSDNGKIDRGALPAPSDQRDRSSGSTPRPPRTEVERALSVIWNDVLGARAAGPEDNFFDLGGDSISSIQVVARAREAGLDLSAKHLFEHPTLGALAESIGRREPRRHGAGETHGALPLSPIQSWFFARRFEEPHHFNQAVLLTLRQPASPRRWLDALQKVTERHDALRLRFHCEDGAWRQELLPVGSVGDAPFVEVDLSSLDGADRRGARDDVKGMLQRSLDLTHGPVLRLALIGSGAAERSHLLWVAHHLVVDAVSWGVLLADLERGVSGSPLSPRTATFADWTRRVTRASEEKAAEANPLARARLPRDHDGPNTVSSSALVTVSLEKEESHSIARELPGTYGIELADAFLAALVEAFFGWTGERQLVVTFEGHGRDEPSEDLDLSRTVGWFTHMYPIALDLRGARDADASLKRAREQRAAAAARSRPGALAAVHDSEVSFNYVGRMGAVATGSTPRLEPSDEGVGPTRSVRGDRQHTIEIVGRLVRERMTFDFIYSRNLHDRTTIEKLSRAFVEGLRALMRHGRGSTIADYKPSDFELAELNRRQMEALMKRRKR